LAAMYHDGSMEDARRHVMKNIVNKQNTRNSDGFKDYKALLQEIIQRNPEESVSYSLLDEKGPDHDKEFTVAVKLNSNTIGVGVGKNKKQAEQMAAKQALELMGENV